MTYKAEIAFIVFLVGPFILGTLVSLGVFLLVKRYITMKHIDRHTSGALKDRDDEIKNLTSENKILWSENEHLIKTIKNASMILNSPNAVHEMGEELVHGEN